MHWLSMSSLACPAYYNYSEERESSFKMEPILKRQNYTHLALLEIENIVDPAVHRSSAVQGQGQ